MKKLLRGVVAGVALTAAVVVLAPTPAQAAAVVCNRYCDGRDPALAPSSRNPVSSTLYGRTFRVYVKDTDAMAWGAVENGSPGDEVWLDRSFDAGRSWPDGSKL